MEALPMVAIEESPGGGPDVFALTDGPTAVADHEFTSPSVPPAPVTLTLDLTGTGTGTVTSTPAGLAVCSGPAQTCLGTFESGTFVTLHASTASGHEFTGWSGACTGTATPCTVTLAGARYVAAHFRSIPPMVTRFYHVDTLGSVRAVTNTAGAETRRDDYHAFGEAGSPPQGDSIRFTGKERDAETALDYFGARYYRNLAGRFTTVDPDHVGGDIFDPQSWNAYGYARNNPLRFVDPTGMKYTVHVFGYGTYEGIPDDEFESMRRSPGRGFGLSNGSSGWITQTVNGVTRTVGYFVQTEVDQNALGAIREAGQRAKPMEGLVGRAMVAGGAVYATGTLAGPALVNLAQLGPQGVAALLAAGKLTSDQVRQLAATSPGLMNRVNTMLFERNGLGLLNGRITGDWLRIGYGWSGSAKEGKEVFRIAIGSKRLPFHFHSDLWNR